MIPNSKDISNNINIVKEPTRTYKLHYDTDDRVVGYTDGLDAIKQAVYKILQTERYEYIIYSWNYGIELQDLYGELIPFVYAELERRIRESLLQDDRILSVEGFTFTNQKTEDKTEVRTTFTVISEYGEIEQEVGVRV